MLGSTCNFPHICPLGKFIPNIPYKGVITITSLRNLTLLFKIKKLYLTSRLFYCFTVY